MSTFEEIPPGQHVRWGGLPADAVAEVSVLIDPPTGEGA